MKATIEIEFVPDGTPTNDQMMSAFYQFNMDTAYIGSESVDGTDKWGLEIKSAVIWIGDEPKGESKA